MTISGCLVLLGIYCVGGTLTASFFGRGWNPAVALLAGFAIPIAAFVLLVFVAGVADNWRVRRDLRRGIGRHYAGISFHADAEEQRTPQRGERL